MNDIVAPPEVRARVPSPATSKFDVDDRIKHKVSGERGTVLAKTGSVSRPGHYYVRFDSGNAPEWIKESDLEFTEERRRDLEPKAERTPHKWANEIKAWADGHTIQHRVKGGYGGTDIWTDAVGMGMPAWGNTALEFRVKPEPRVEWQTIYTYGSARFKSREFADQEVRANSDTLLGLVRLEFDFETGKLVKAEVVS